MSHHASIIEDTKVVNQTILWAREALQRRRKELQERKSICSNNEESVLGLSQSLPSPGRTLSSTELHSTLERGRALLASADAHSEILRKYIEMDRSLYCSYSQRTPVGSTTETPFFDVPQNYEDEEAKPMLPDDIIDGDDEDQGEILKKSKGREILDGLVTDIGQQDESDITTPEKRTVSNFDPSMMNSAKRAIIKKIKLDDAVATAEEQARLLTSFKALPLPGGVEVTSNLYATTQSFEGKHAGSVEKLIRRRRDSTQNDKLRDESSLISGKFCTRDDFSSVRSLISCDNSFMQSEFENDVDREMARELIAEKKLKKRELLKSVNKIVSESMQSVEQEDNESSVFSESYDLVEDPSKLRQDIARLEAKLKHKKSQRDATLNDIVDIDLNSIFDTFLPGETSDNARQIIDRLKKRAFHCVDDFHYVTPTADENAREALINVPQRISVVQRQEEWSKRREQKLFNARMQLEADAMDGVTGRPEISQTSQSWKRAKESHDETLKIIAEVEEKKSRDKAAKEKALNEIKAEKERQLQEQSKPKFVKCEVKKEEQMKRLEMLSRPRQTIEATIHVESSTDAATSTQHPDHSPMSRILDPIQLKKEKTTKPKREKKVKPNMESNLISNEHRFNSEKDVIENSTAVSFLDKKPDDFYGLSSFSDMSDKEFSKLVKRISRNA